MHVVVRFLAKQQLAALYDPIVAIYRDAFKAPPYSKGEDEVMEFARFFPQHVEQEGFRLVVAIEARTGEPVGFAYGFRNAPGQGWYEVVASLMPPQTVAEWLTGSFRLAEMAVASGAQGRGVGGLLHDQLLTDLPYRRAVLSTTAAKTNAFWLYHKRGWQVLIDTFDVPGLPRPYRIMGLDLKIVSWFAPAA